MRSAIYNKVVKSLYLLTFVGFNALAIDFPTQKVDQKIQQYINDDEYQGTVLISRGDKVLYHKAFGYRDREAKKRNQRDTQFLIGSLTKSFTAVAVMKLVEMDVLELYQPLSAYLPGLNPELGKLNLHLLLKQQSGFRGHLENMMSFENKDVDSADIFDVINHQKLTFEQGTDYHYSNLNFHLAALVLEAVTQKSYRELMQELVFAPLKMVSSGVERIAFPPKNRAKGYRKGTFGVSHAENIVSYAIGSGDIYSTAADLHKWGVALRNNQLLSKKSKRLLFNPASENKGHYGYGFRILDYERKDKSIGKLVRHGGSMDGFLSNFHYYTDDDLFVIVLGNIRLFPIRNMTRDLKNIALGVDPETQAVRE